MRRFYLIATCLTLAGCAVGPDFFSPAPPAVKTYTEGEPLTQTTSADTRQGAAQTFVSGTDVPVNWWILFGSDPLNKLVADSIKGNPDLEAARLSLRQAKENYMAARGALLPEADLGAGDTRERFNPAAFGETGVPTSIFTLYNASVNISYTLDVFGETRREIEAAHAQEDLQRYQMLATYLTLTGNMVTAVMQEASLTEQVKETENIADLESKQLDVLQKQFELGGIAKTAVLEQQSALAQTQATLPPLQKLLAQTRNQIAILGGHFPGNTVPESFSLDDLRLPESLPLTLPSNLIKQRPDIQQAEATLHQANAEVGVATAEMLPQVTLSGTLGYESVHFRDLVTPGTQVWSIGANILQPLFHGGTLLHQRRAAVAARDKAYAQYQSAVLAAFKNVADTLRALQYDAEGLKAQLAAEVSAKTSLDLAQAQYKDGAINYPQLLDAQRTYAQTRIGLVQAQAARLSDTAALYIALGGGWSSKTPATPPSPVTATSLPAPSPNFIGPMPQAKPPTLTIEKKP